MEKVKTLTNQNLMDNNLRECRDGNGIEKQYIKFKNSILV